MTGSTSSLKNSLLNRAWIQWIALGVDAVGERDDAVVDPEALIALTAELGDADARLAHHLLESRSIHVAAARGASCGQ